MKLSFRTRATLVIGSFTVALTIAVLALGDYLNESIEEAIWDRLLAVQLQQFDLLRDHQAAINASESVRVYMSKSPNALGVDVPTYLSRLKPGIHDDVKGDHKRWTVLVRDLDNIRQYLAYDVTALEREEHALQRRASIYVLIMLLLAILTSYFIAAKLASPLLRLAAQIATRRPDGKMLDVTRYRDNVEVAKIATSINEHTQAIEGFYRKERDLYAMVGHEIRTPIAIITGAAEIVQQRQALDAELAAPLQRIVRAAKDLNATLTTILFIARNESPLHDAEVRCRVDDLLDTLLQDHRYLLNESQQIRLERIEPTEVVASSKTVALVLGNLIRNAIQHAPEGVISISLSDGLFSIQDSGPGFPPDVINATSLSSDWVLDREHGGGIGLTLAQRIAKRQGWTIQIANTDNGARVSVQFFPVR